MLKYTLKSNKNTEKYTKKTIKRQYSHALKMCVHIQIRTSIQFCTQHEMDLGYSPTDRTKWHLEESELYCKLSDN